MAIGSLSDQGLAGKEAIVSTSGFDVWLGEMQFLRAFGSTKKTILSTAGCKRERR